MIVVGQPMPWLQSAAFCFLVPAGAAYDPPARSGLSTFTCEMLLRGCGSRDSRQFITDLENLGVERAEGASDGYASFGGAMMAENLLPALSIYADLLRRPHLPEDQLEAGRMVVLQELQGVDDELAQKLLIELRKCHYPAPWGRPAQGDFEGLEAISIDDIRGMFQRSYRPNGTILGVAGQFEWPRLLAEIESLFGDWNRAPDTPLKVTGQRVPRAYIEQDSQQTHIGLAFPSVPLRHPDYLLAGAGVSVLSGGMSSRLFTEVREKRGLCYSVFASYHTLLDRASVQCYAGSRPERAQETLDVLISELQRLAQGVDQSEMDRVKAQFKSMLVMQQESSFSRSSGLARDWLHLGRARTLEEIMAQVDAMTLTDLNRFLAEHPAQEFTIATLGPQSLEVPVAVS